MGCTDAEGQPPGGAGIHPCGRPTISLARFRSSSPSSVNRTLRLPRMNSFFPSSSSRSMSLFSGNAGDVCEKLDKGCLDFGILLEPVNLKRYDYVRLPSSTIREAL